MTLGLFFCFSLSSWFWKVLVRNSKELCYGRLWMGKLSQQKKSQNATLFFFLFIVSHSGVGFSKFFALGVFFTSL